MSDNFITPSDIYEGGTKEFQTTPPGVYAMALAGKLQVARTKDGKRKLKVFFKHTDEIAKKTYSGVNGSVLLEGLDKNGRPLVRQFADMLYALGVSKEDACTIANGQSDSGVIELAEIDDLPADEQWKGVEAMIQLNGDSLDLIESAVQVKVIANTYNGKTTARADAFYPTK